jgi:hypothetical protein
VLNAALRPVPVGVPGELCVGGAQVGRGYLADADLTAQRFIELEGADGRIERLYRTGDRVRWRPDGALEFLGRADDQVKLRGVRIELGEIESALRAQPGVRAAAVLARDASGRAIRGGSAERLVAFVEAADEGSVAGVSRALRNWVPSAMIPAEFHRLDALPLSPNGKTDRSALAASLPDLAPADSPRGWIAPRTPMEELVAGVWSELLGVERVGAMDGFYELGGHSLLAMQAVSRFRRVLGAEVPLRTLFEAPRVADLAGRLEALIAGAPAGAPPIVAVPRNGGPLPVSFAQRRIWFLQRLDPDSVAYNLHGAVRIRGDLDEGALALAFERLVERHESLRTVFEERDGEPVQRILAPAAFAMETIDLATVTDSEQDRVVDDVIAEGAAFRFDLGAWSAAPCNAAPPPGRVASAGGGDAPHRHGRLVRAGAARGDVRAVPCGARRRGCIAAGAAGAVRRFRRVAARLAPRRGSGIAARVLA